MHQGFFGTIHGARALIAIVVKVAVVVAAFVLLGQASALSNLGIPVLLVHAGALAVIAGVLIWQSAHGSMAAKAGRPVAGEQKAPHVGIILHSAALYDALAWFLTFGRERTFRERMLSFAKLKSGEAVVDVGCGTGTVALLAKKKVGPEGRVDGIDASAQMIARARAKARRAGLQVGFSAATAQELPFKDGEFDVVLSTLMFHHLPKKGREEFGREAFRVLKPGGRVLIVDFAKPPRQKSTFRFHRHGHVDLDRVAANLGQRGFNIVERGDVGTKGLRYLVAQRQPDLNPGALEAR
jgi:ubiquinone/menaquinone biosynthesis C-methylase UbiE